MNFSSKYHDNIVNVTFFGEIQCNDIATVYVSMVTVENVELNTQCHGYEPNQLKLSVVISATKCCTKSINDIGNYRPINIMPTAGKMFEKCIANIIEPYFVFRENQFRLVNMVVVARFYLFL